MWRRRKGEITISNLFFQPNLVASGAAESEIFIWDLTNPKVPMSPGAKVQPADDVTDLEWNKQGTKCLCLNS